MYALDIFLTNFQNFDKTQNFSNGMAGSSSIFFLHTFVKKKQQQEIVQWDTLLC